MANKSQDSSMSQMLSYRAVVSYDGSWQQQFTLNFILSRFRKQTVNYLSDVSLVEITQGYMPQGPTISLATRAEQNHRRPISPGSSSQVSSNSHGRQVSPPIAALDQCVHSVPRGDRPVGLFDLNKKLLISAGEEICTLPDTCLLNPGLQGTILFNSVSLWCIYNN